MHLLASLNFGGYYWTREQNTPTSETLKIIAYCHFGFLGLTADVHITWQIQSAGAELLLTCMHSEKAPGGVGGRRGSPATCLLVVTTFLLSFLCYNVSSAPHEPPPPVQAWLRARMCPLLASIKSGSGWSHAFPWLLPAIRQLMLMLLPHPCWENLRGQTFAEMDSTQCMPQATTGHAEQPRAGRRRGSMRARAGVFPPPKGILPIAHIVSWNAHYGSGTTTGKSTWRFFAAVSCVAAAFSARCLFMWNGTSYFAERCCRAAARITCIVDPSGHCTAYIIHTFGKRMKEIQIFRCSLCGKINVLRPTL